MKRRRYDSDSEDENGGDQQQQQALVPPSPIAAPAAVPAPPAPVSSFGGGTLFSKGKRTQLASDLASRVEHGDLGGELPSSGLLLSSMAADQFSLDGGSFAGNNNRRAVSSRSGSQPMTLLDQLNESTTSNPTTPYSSAVAAAAAAAGLLGGSHQKQQRPSQSHNDAMSSAAGGSAEILPIAAAGSSPHAPPMLQPAVPTVQPSSAAVVLQRPTVPMGLTSIRAYISKGLRPQMNCRIQDDESGRSGVWLPPSTVIAAANLAAAAHSQQQPQSAADAGSPTTANPTGGAAASGDASAAASNKKKGGAPSTSVSTLLSVRPLVSDRVQPAMFSTVATTGPIPMNVMRSLKGVPLPSRGKKQRNGDGSSSDDGKGDSDGEGREGGAGKGGAADARRGGRGEGGRGRGGRGRGGFTAASRFADETPAEIVKHFDVGGGGLQHPYFNGYCSAILGKLALSMDAAVPEKSKAVAPQPTSLSNSGSSLPISPTEQSTQDFAALLSATAAANGGGGMSIMTAGGGPFASSSSSSIAGGGGAPPTRENVTPCLTVLSKDLTTRDVLSLYCGGSALNTAKPRKAPPRTAANASEADAAKEAEAAEKEKERQAAAEGIAHSAATKPHTYAVADAYGDMSIMIRSGWRWDGIVRGNPRALAKYAVTD